MLKLRSFKAKMAVAISVTAAIIFGIIITYAATTNLTEAKRNAKHEMQFLAEKYALKIEAEIEIAMDASNTIAYSFAATKRLDKNTLNRTTALEQLKEVLSHNPNFLGTYTCWEPNAFDNKDALYANTNAHDSTGRFIPYWIQDSDGKLTLEALLDYEKEGIGNWYLIPKRTKKEAILEPFIYPVKGKDVLLTSLVTPIVVNDVFYGIAGADMSIDFIQEYAVNAKNELLDGNVEIAIIANSGTYAASTSAPERIGKTLAKFYTKPEEQLKIIQKGKNHTAIVNDSLTVHIPIKIGKTETPWQVQISIDENYMNSKARTQMWFIILLGIVLIVAGVL